MAKADAKVFRSRLSGWIIGMYLLILAFLVAMLIAVPLTVGMSPYAIGIFIGAFVMIIIVFIVIIARAMRMKFTVTQDHVIVNGIFGNNMIAISDIKSVEKIPMPLGVRPFGFRLFGASFLGGLYYLPGIGMAWVSMGNFSDGVLIIMKRGKHYVITPETPLDFIKKVNGRIRVK